jgi:hypothetical protein
MDDEEDPLIQVQVVFEGHTFLYRYHHGQREAAKDAILGHAAIGLLHPYAAAMALRYVRKAAEKME